MIHSQIVKSVIAKWISMVRVIAVMIVDVRNARE